MTRLSILALASILFGCEETVRVYAPYITEEEVTIALDAADRLDIDVEFVPRSGGGVITLHIWGLKNDESQRGVAVVRPCRCTAIASRDVIAVAHEIGHCLGLRHKDDPDNIMYRSMVDDGVITTSQSNEMRRVARRLNSCP